jgi:hypothetical protein
MEFGETIFLALVVVSFGVFAGTLAVVSWLDSRHRSGD